MEKFEPNLALPMQTQRDTVDMINAIVTEVNKIPAATKAAEAAQAAAEAAQAAAEEASGQFAVKINMTGDVLTIDDAEAGFEPVQLISHIPHIQTGDPSPANPCPITGHDAAHVYRTCKNMCEVGTVSFKLYKIVELSVPIPPGTYTMSAVVTSNDTVNQRCNVHFYSGDNVKVRRLFDRSKNGERIKQEPITFTTEITAIYFYASGSYADSVGVNATFADIQIEAGEVATDYEPFQGQTLTAALPETVYGGTLDWGTGVLTIDRALVERAVSDMSNTEDNPGWKDFPDLRTYFAEGVNNAISCPMSIGKTINVNTTGDNNIVYFPMDIYGMTQTEWMSTYPDLVVQFVFPLVEPQLIQLTPQQLTLMHEQQIRSSTGDTSIRYVVDLKDYIDKVIAEKMGGNA